jgi:hypothetical protein
MKMSLRTRNRRDRGALLGIVMILLSVVLSVGALALWNLRADTGSAGRTHLSHQLFDCAEEGLAWGNQYFASTARLQWDTYLSSGKSMPGTVTMNGRAFTYQITLVNNPENPPSPQSDQDNQVLVVSRCSDVVSSETRAVQALITSPLPVTLDYQSQAGHGFRNQNNFD